MQNFLRFVVEIDICLLNILSIRRFYFATKAEQVFRTLQRRFDESFLKKPVIYARWSIDADVKHDVLYFFYDITFYSYL